MGVSFISREKCWIFTCLLVCVDTGLSLTVSQGYLLTAFGDLTQCFLLLLVLLVFLQNITASEQRTKLFWTLMALGSGIWLFAQMLWTYFEVFLGQEVPNPFGGDVILFLHLVPMMGALAAQPHRERNEQTTSLGMLDFVLLLVWWLYLFLFAVIPWQYVWPDAAIYGRNFDLLYFLEHLVFLVCAAAVWWRSTGVWRAVYAQLFGAGLLYALGSLAASFAIDLGKYYTGSLYDVPLIVSMAWFIGTGLVARKLIPRTEPPRETEPRRRLWVSGLSMVTILSLPVLAGWALYFSNAPLPVRNFRMELTLFSMMLMAGLVWIKQHRLDKELARANQELREDSLTDLLTGARNRRFLTTIIESDVRHAIRSHFPLGASHSKRNRDLIFYLIDSDSFKDVNDRHGHDLGDQLLVEISRRISSAIRHSDVLIRWGGDEFLVVSRYNDREDAATLAARVLHAVAGEPFELRDGICLQRTCSIGWAAFPWFIRDPGAVGYREVLRLADYALYRAKKSGKNQAIGMLPTRDEPLPGPGSIPVGRHDRLAEHLAARTVVTSGPQMQESDQKFVQAAAATQTP